MITKEQAVKLAKEKEEQIKIENAKLVEGFCETSANEEIEKAAQLGEYKVDIGCNNKYAHDIANYLRTKGFAVRVDTINSRNANLQVSWN